MVASQQEHSQLLPITQVHLEVQVVKSVVSRTKQIPRFGLSKPGSSSHENKVIHYERFSDNGCGLRVHGGFSWCS